MDDKPTDQGNATVLPEIYFDGISVTTTKYDVIMTLRLINSNDESGVHKSTSRPVTNIRFAHELAGEIAQILTNHLNAIKSIQVSGQAADGDDTLSSGGRMN
jgi:hypothetical protein